MSTEGAGPCHCEASVYLFGKLWAVREVPEDWKKANVTPVFKKGKKENPRDLVSEKMTEQILLEAIS